MARTLAEIDADIAKFQKAQDDLVLGKRLQGVKHGDREAQYGSNFSATERSIARRLRELAAERARITGDLSPNRPVGV